MKKKMSEKREKEKNLIVFGVSFVAISHYSRDISILHLLLTFYFCVKATAKKKKRDGQNGRWNNGYCFTFFVFSFCSVKMKMLLKFILNI